MGALLVAGPTSAQESGTAADRGVLLPGDVIRLNIWNEPELTGDYGVDESGVVVLPKIGPVAVEGRSPAELKTHVMTELRRYLRNPSIDIVFLRRVNILGSVRQPGVYAVDPTTTIAEALARAGGTTPEGKSDEVEIHRGGQILMTDVRQLDRITDTPLRSGDQLFVPERSWFSRNTAIVATGISAAVSIVITVISISSRGS